jgi:hypothetical protein
VIAPIRPRPTNMTRVGIATNIKDALRNPCRIVGVRSEDGSSLGIMEHRHGNPIFNYQFG